MNSIRFYSRGQAKSLPFQFFEQRVFPRVLAILLVAAIGVAWAPALSLAQAPEGSYDETEAQAIDRMLMCPVCPAESIDQAQVPLAKQMRQRVREMLASGASRQEVLDYFADRYGTEVLASPPKSGFTLLAWVLPVVGLLIALAAVLLVLRAMTGKSAEESETVSEEEGSYESLEPYLAAVDRSLEIGETVDSSEGVEESDGPEGSGRDR